MAAKRKNMYVKHLQLTMLNKKGLLLKNKMINCHLGKIRCASNNTHTHSQLFLLSNHHQLICQHFLMSQVLNIVRVRYLISTVWICIRNKSKIIIFRAYHFSFKWDEQNERFMCFEWAWLKVMGQILYHIGSAFQYIYIIIQND